MNHRKTDLGIPFRTKSAKVVLVRYAIVLNHSVMAGLVPAIHVFLRCGTDVDARHKAGHDGACGSSRAGTALVVSLLCVLVSGLFVRFHVRLR